MPMPFSAEPTKRGTASPSKRAAVTPRRRSSRVNFSPAKYFSMRTSSLSATTSAISSYIRSVALTWSWVKSASRGVPSVYLKPFWKITSVTPTKLSPSPMGTEKGMTFLPKASSNSSINFLKLTFSSSILLTKIRRGRPIFSQYFHIRSVPAWTPEVASMTIKALSAARRAL